MAYVAAQALTSDGQFLAWGWCVPFLAGLVLVGLAVYVHRRVPESPDFAGLTRGGTRARGPVMDVLRRHPKQVALATEMRVGESGGLYVLTVFLLTYGPQRLGVPRVTILAGVVLATLLGLVTIPFFGALSDRLGRRPVYLAGAASLLVLSFPLFQLVETGSAPLIWLAIILGVNGALGLMHGPQAAWFSELFATSVRYSGVSLSSQFGFVLGGGLAPILTTRLVDGPGMSAGLVAHLAVAALISFLSAWFTAETFHADITADRPEERVLMGPPDAGTPSS